MPSILSIQSHVAYGHAGNSAVVFPLQRLGAEVWPIDTVQFSSNAGYPGWRGRAFDPGLIDECVAGLGAIGVLENCDAVLTGYLGKPDMGEAGLRALGSVRAANAQAIYCCDPVIGDVGKGVYVAAGVAEFFRDRALGCADIATPNAFELGWWTDERADDAAGLRVALRSLHGRGPRVVLVTSLRLADTPAEALDMAASDGEHIWRVRTPMLPLHVSGAGDLTTALFLLHWLRTGSAPGALASVAASVYGVVAATAALGRREMAIVAAQDQFANPSHHFRPEPL